MSDRNQTKNEKRRVPGVGKLFSAKMPLILQVTTEGTQKASKYAHVKNKAENVRGS